MEELLRVRNLKVHFATYAGTVQAVRGVDLSLDRGEALALVGESGCGKSVTALSILKLLPFPQAKIVTGSALFRGADLVRKTEREMEQIRGRDIGMIFQDPMTSLNPTMTVGNQIMEVLKKHKRMNRSRMVDRAVEMLRLTGVHQSERRLTQYPHEFSGGMRQRAMIAMALACGPQLLMADEPTTALDVTIQAQIIELMQDLRRKLGTAIILITHDLGVVAGFAERIAVMYAGKIIESGPTAELFAHPAHPYTRGLLGSIPRVGDREKRPLTPIAGRPPDLINPPPGCAFWPRCGQPMRICAQREPESTRTGPGHTAACWLLHPQAGGEDVMTTRTICARRAGVPAG